MVKKYNNWEERINLQGYVEIKCKFHPNNRKGWIFKHRWIFEKKLKRFLRPDEIIHHINGNRQDNRIENLRMFKSDSDHYKAHSNFISLKEKQEILDDLYCLYGINRFINQSYARE